MDKESWAALLAEYEAFGMEIDDEYLQNYAPLSPTSASIENNKEILDSKEDEETILNESEPDAKEPQITKYETDCIVETAVVTDFNSISEAINLKEPLTTSIPLMSSASSNNDVISPKALLISKYDSDSVTAYNYSDEIDELEAELFAQYGTADDDEKDYIQAEVQQQEADNDYYDSDNDKPLANTEENDSKNNTLNYFFVYIIYC